MSRTEAVNYLKGTYSMLLKIENIKNGKPSNWGVRCVIFPPDQKAPSFTKDKEQLTKLIGYP